MLPFGIIQLSGRKTLGATLVVNPFFFKHGKADFKLSHLKLYHHLLGGHEVGTLSNTVKDLCQLRVDEGII